MENFKMMDSLKDLLTERFDEFGDKVAFLEKDKAHTEYQKIGYTKLKEDINALGTVMLEELGLKDKKIAVIGENSYRWFVTYMAVVCGVGVIVPLDKELPQNEILNLLQRSDSRCIVYSSRKKDLVEGLKKDLPKDMILIEMNKEASDEISYAFDSLVENGKELVDTGHTAYIDTKINRDEFRILLFTSGTTGNAKGVMLNHKNLCVNVNAAAHIIPKMGEYTVLSVLPMHHTYEFTLGFLFVLSLGGTVGICEGLKYVSKNLQEVKPDAMFAVPALAENMYKKIEKAIRATGKEKLINAMRGITTGLSKIGIDIRRKVFKQVQDQFGGKLRYMFVGAAPLDKELVKKLQGLGFTILQGYGLTETAPLVATTLLDNNVPGTVGRGVAGVEVRIDLSENDDENSNVGEIIVKGDNVMMGYYENEAETKKALKKGWFYTGDVGYFDLQGNLVVSGRNKNVIVTANGKNIFPEELENEINKIPLVEESMVYGMPDPKDKNEVIVAAKVTLNEEYIEEKYASARPTDQELHDMIWTEVKKINRTMVPYKAIKKLEVKKEAFVKTTTMKIKRFEELKKDKKDPKKKK